MLAVVPKQLSKKILSDPQRGAEVRVYNALVSQLPKSDDYFVFYSVDWYNQNPELKRNDGECDFIIAHPAHGILFIEVKGGEVTRDGVSREWLSNGFPITNPVKQALQSKHAILEHIKIRWEKQERNRMPFITMKHAVLLPGSKKSTQDLGIVADIEMFGFEEDLENIYLKIIQFFAYKQALKPQSKKFIEDQKKAIKILEKMLTKDIDFTYSYLDYINRREAKIKEVSDQILDLYERIKGNQKIKYTGPAGSGKTYLGIQAALQEGSEKNKDILFVCYNKPLSLWARQKTRDLNNIRVSTFHSLCYELLEPTGLSAEPLEKFDENVTCLLANSSLIKSHFDFIVVDEFQDFEKDWFDIIRSLLRDDSSKILLLSDCNQNIWGRSEIETEGFTKVDLNKILRNTHWISKSSEAYYSGIPFECVGPVGQEIQIIASGDNITDMERAIRRLQNEGISLQDISVLTDFNIQEKVKLELEKKLNLAFKNCEHLGESIIMDTIKRFKGLESKVIILWLREVTLNMEDLYIGFTRARSDLLIICSSIMKTYIERDIKNYLE